MKEFLTSVDSNTNSQNISEELNVNHIAVFSGLFLRKQVATRRSCLCSRNARKVGIDKYIENLQLLGIIEVHEISTVSCRLILISPTIERDPEKLEIQSR